MSKLFGGALFRRYVAYLGSVLAIALAASSGTSLYFAYQDTRHLLDELQRDKARAAAVQIEELVKSVEIQARGALPVVSSRAHDLAERELDLLKLLRLAPAVTEAAWIDGDRRERVRVSRLGRDTFDTHIDRSLDPSLESAAAARVWYSSIYYQGESTPHFVLTVAGSQRPLGFVVVTVNLTFVAEVVGGIRVGGSGHAYVVDGEGRLIAHPDLSAVLRQTDLSRLEQVQAAVAAPEKAEQQPTIIGHDEQGRRALTAYARIPSVGWNVLVEQPLEEAFATVYAHATRAALVLLLALLIAVGASVLLARRLVEPIRKLQAGVKRIADGELTHTVHLKTGDDLEDLADQFNVMAERLHNFYEGLEETITARTRELAQANRAKTLFFAAASHDLRQPIHALGLYLAQLESLCEDDPASQLVKKTAASHAAVSDLLDELLDLSQLDAGAVKPRYSACDLRQFFSRIEHVIAPSAAARELRVRIRHRSLTVFTDPVLLERIVLNLAANAVRYTHSGGVLIGARVRGDGVRIDVYDTGSGIAPDQQRAIFDPFYRAHPQGDASNKGLGLGLAIVRRLAKLLDCEVEVRSTIGRGSRFSVLVPRAAASAERARERMDAVHAVNEAAVILLIDDDRAAREAAEGLLVRWGYHVWSARSEAEALAHLERAPAVPDAIISDYQLEHGSRGTDVIEALRKRAGVPIPGVLLTGDAGAEPQAAAEAAGVHLLKKPLQPGKLRAVLQHVLSSSADAHPHGSPAVLRVTGSQELVGIES